MILGFPHDVAGFALLMHILAQRLGVEVGTYSHSISNAHVYDIHYDTANELITRKNSHAPILLDLPEKSFERSELGDHAMVAEIVDALASQYEPLDAIKGLQIVL